MGTKGDTHAKRHHYVPVFLLQRFANANGQLHQLDTRSGKPGRCNPADAACVKGYYRYRYDEGDWQNDLEPALAQIEDMAAAALRRLEDVDVPKGAEDRATIAVFLALQHARTPYGQGMSLELHRTVMTSMLEVDLTNQPTERLSEILGEDGVPLTHEEAERQRTDLLARLASGSIRLEAQREAALQAMVDSMQETAPIIEDLAWSLLEAPPETGFVISDTPVTMWNPGPRRFVWSGDAWCSGPKAETTLPLSPKLCLRVTPIGDDFETRQVTRGEVDAINARAFAWADRWIYAPSQQALQDLRRLTKRRPDLVTRPRPGRTVILEDADPRTARPPHPGWPGGLWVRGQGFQRYKVSSEEIRRRRR